MTEISAEYLAGLFDGEGWFSLYRQNGSHSRSKRPWRHGIRVSMVLREKWMVDAFQERFGGTVTVVKSRSENHSTYYKWCGSGATTQAFVDEVGPYLRLKSSQAALARDFLAEKKLQGNQPVSDERYQKYEQAFEEMKRLNERGSGK